MNFSLLHLATTCVFFISQAGLCQPVLTLKQAIETGLQNNFDVRIARNDAEMARQSNTYGNAGFLPSVAVNAGSTVQSTDIHQEFSSGLVVERGGATSTNTSAGLGVSWILFDGGKMFITKRKLGVQQEAGMVKLQAQMQNLADTIAAAYYQIVLARLDLAVTRQDIVRTEERLKISNAQNLAGTRSKSDLLVAQIDMNVLKTRQLAQQSQEQIRKGNLNQLLARDPAEAFTVEDNIALAPKTTYDELKEKLKLGNPQLRYQQRLFDVSKLTVEELKTRRLPQVAFNGGYNFSQVKNEAGFSLLSQSLGPSIGLSLSMPLYAGNSVRQLLRLANLDIATKDLQLQLAESRLTTHLWRAIQQRDAQLDAIELEQESVQLATENLAIAQGRFRLAQSTSLELKDAELQLSNAQTRLNQARYNAKIAESQISRLSNTQNSGR